MVVGAARYDGAMEWNMAADGDGVVVAVKVVPNASRDVIVGLLGDALKVKVAAPPEGGRANAAVEALLAAALGVAARNVSVVGGHTQARKRVRIGGVGVERVRKLL